LGHQTCKNIIVKVAYNVLSGTLTILSQLLECITGRQYTDGLLVLCVPVH